MSVSKHLTGSSVFQKLMISDFHTNQSREFTQNKKNTIIIITNNNNNNNSREQQLCADVEQKSMSECKHLEPLGV